jgi:hypothetical protein
MELGHGLGTPALDRTFGNAFGLSTAIPEFHKTGMGRFASVV